MPSKKIREEKWWIIKYKKEYKYDIFAEDNGFKYLVLGTYERMERAIGFYKKNLFILDDIETEDVEERYFRKCLA